MSGRGVRSWGGPLIDAQIISDAGGFVQADATTTATPDKLALRDVSADSAFATVKTNAVCFPASATATVTQDDAISGAGGDTTFHAQKGEGANADGGFVFEVGDDQAFNMLPLGAQLIWQLGANFSSWLQSLPGANRVFDVRLTDATAFIQFCTRSLRLNDNAIANFGEFFGNVSGLASYLMLKGGDNALVSAANEFRLRYDTVTQKAQISENTGAWTNVISAAGDGAWVYGDGSDGDVTLGSDTTITRDMFYNNLTTGGFDLIADGYRVYVKGTLTIGAGDAVHNDGNSAIGTAGGGDTNLGTLGVGKQGGNAGGVGTLASSSGGGAGGAGGGTGGAGGAAIVASVDAGRANSPPAGFQGSLFGGGFALLLNGGGGGGGGQSGTNGGGGGGAGGSLMVAAKVIVNAGRISADGGIGGNAGASVGGGGGGGGGGLLHVFVRDLSGVGTITAGGGAGGTGDGAADGSTGSAGTAVTHAAT